jgi:hypothetical protein
MQVKKKSQLQEKSVAKDLNAKTVVASGALWGSKGDVRHDNLLVECKTTDKGFYSLSLTVWDKIEKEAIRDGLRIPVMCIDLNGGKERYAVFLDKDFKHYKERYEIYDGEETLWTTKKSFRVKEPVRILVLRDKQSGETPCFVVTPWSDFLYMLKGGEKI